jgi:hypothetical protein
MALIPLMRHRDAGYAIHTGIVDAGETHALIRRISDAVAEPSHRPLPQQPPLLPRPEDRHAGSPVILSRPSIRPPDAAYSRYAGELGFTRRGSRITARLEAAIERARREGSSGASMPG